MYWAKARLDFLFSTLNEVEAVFIGFRMAFEERPPLLRFPVIRMMGFYWLRDS